MSHNRCVFLIAVSALASCEVQESAGVAIRLDRQGLTCPETSGVPGSIQGTCADAGTGSVATVPISGFTAVTDIPATGGAKFIQGRWYMFSTAAFVYYPIQPNASKTLYEFSWFTTKNNLNSVLSADVIEVDIATGAQQEIANSLASAGSGLLGDRVVSTAGLGYVMRSDKTYAVRVFAQQVANGLDNFGDVTIGLF